jgi:hypothetical protein
LSSIHTKRFAGSRVSPAAGGAAQAEQMRGPAPTLHLAGEGYLWRAASAAASDRASAFPAPV